MTVKKGEKLWFIPDGYIPPISNGEDMVSHESICVLNCYNVDAHVEVTIYFEDREPIKKIPVTVQAERTYHIRTSSLNKDGQSIPVAVPYAMEVTSDVPVIVQYSRLDTTQPELALMSTMGYPVATD